MSKPDIHRPEAPGSQASEAPTLVKQRLAHSLGATILGPIITTLIQVLSVPVYLAHWGAETYGAWLVVSAIPSYLALSDIGLGSVAANDMTLRTSAGDRLGALRTFQSTWVIVTLISMAIATVSAIVLARVPLDSVLKSPSQLGPLRLLILVLALYSLVTLQNTIISAGFRCVGRFASGVMLQNGARLVEGIAVIATLLMGGAPLSIALVSLCLRVLSTVVFAVLMRRFAPWLNFGYKTADLARIRQLIGPALAFMALPAANAISLQGTVGAIGWVLGPAAVAPFATMRTLTRFVIQLVEPLKNSYWPELTTALGCGRRSLAIQLHRQVCQLALGASTLASLLLFVAGPFIYSIWTHNRLHFDGTTFNLLLLVVLANALWNASSIVCLSTNSHQEFALAYLASTIVSLLLAFVLMQKLGLRGAALSLLIGDVGIGWYVVRQSVHTLGDKNGQFARSLMDLDSLRIKYAN